MISLVVAMDKNFLIGSDGKMPWNVPEDLKKFKEMTENGVVIMGRKTYESIGKPLPNRINIVLSGDKNYSLPSPMLLAHSLEEAVDMAKSFKKEIFIIGGAQIYGEALEKNLIDRLCISFIKGDFIGDTFFPLRDFSHYKLMEQTEYKDFIYKEYLELYK